MPRITTIALDADDTLWQNEQFFRLTEQRFSDLLRDYTDAPDLTERLISATARNLQFYGFGAKGFSLSMVETALEVTDHRVPGTVIAEILAAGRELVNFPIETLPYVDEALGHLQDRYRLIHVTKGDLFDQERKLAASGLADYFASGIAVKPLGTFVPTDDDAIEILANYGVVGRLHDGRQEQV